MKNHRGNRLKLRRITVQRLEGAGGGWYRSYGAGCSYSCNTCQEIVECWNDPNRTQNCDTESRDKAGC